MKKRICILSFSNIAWDARVLRQIEFAKEKYQVDVVGYGEWEPVGGVAYHRITPHKSKWTDVFARTFYLLAGRFFPHFWDKYFWKKSEYVQARQVLSDGKYDLIHANDWDALPVAVVATDGTHTQVIYDAHEYTPGQYSQYITGHYLKSFYYVYFLKKYSKTVAKFITVSDGIADLYAKNFGWEASVVRNAPAYKLFADSPIDKNHIKLVHHGAAVSGRQLEDLLHLVPLLDQRFSLTFILVPSNVRYLKYLKKISNTIDKDRIIFLDPVPPALVTQTLTAYDIGIPVLPPVNLNHLYALPNKFFDYIMSGIGVATLALPEMKRIIETHKIGVASNNFSWQNLATHLNALSGDQISVFKKNSHILAKQFNAEVEMGKLVGFYDEITGSG